MGKDKLNMPHYFVADKVDTHLVKGQLKEDTVFHKAADLQGINQFGDHVSLNKDLPGKILLVNFFFTTCPSICPRLTRNIKKIQKAYRPTPMKDNKDLIQFISITVNPERDSAKVLFEYAKKYEVDMNYWWFITGDKQTLFNYAKQELHLFGGDGNGGIEDFDHTQQLVLLDADRNIRGYYDGLNEDDIRKCADDIGKLTMEKKHR